MKINTALILCAGFGKRLNPLTLETPKPLLELKRVTMLENCINLIMDNKKIYDAEDPRDSKLTKDQLKKHFSPEIGPAVIYQCPNGRKFPVSFGRLGISANCSLIVFLPGYIYEEIKKIDIKLNPILGLTRNYNVKERVEKTAESKEYDEFRPLARVCSFLGATYCTDM